MTEQAKLPTTPREAFELLMSTDEVFRLRAQRDELLVALKDLVEGDAWKLVEALERARAVIAAVEEKP